MAVSGSRTHAAGGADGFKTSPQYPEHRHDRLDWLTRSTSAGTDLRTGAASPVAAAAAGDTLQHFRQGAGHTFAYHGCRTSPSPCSEYLLEMSGNVF